MYLGKFVFINISMIIKDNHKSLDRYESLSLFKEDTENGFLYIFINSPGTY